MADDEYTTERMTWEVVRVLREAGLSVRMRAPLVEPDGSVTETLAVHTADGHHFTVYVRAA